MFNHRDLLRGSSSNAGSKQPLLEMKPQQHVICYFSEGHPI